MLLDRLTLALATVALVAAPLAAQVTETPVAFDSAGRVPTITQPLAERLRLAPPAWPVLGSFVNARLYSRSDSGFTLVVARSNGALDRYAMSEGAANALRSLVRDALANGRRAGLGEQTTLYSDPAGNAFVRNQALLGLFIYGPAASVLAGSSSSDGSAAAAAELLVAGGTFFAALARRSADPPVTTAQNIVATHGAIQGAALGGSLAYVAHVRTPEAAALMVLGGSIGGTMSGLGVARRMTDGEAAAASLGGYVLPLTTLGVMGAAGAFDGHSEVGRPAAGAASAAILLGYPLGLAYTRRAPYTVTAGDVRAMSTSAALGVAIAATPFIDGERHDQKAQYAALTGGLLGGMILGDRLLVRPRDHTRSDGALLWTGATAGALVGLGVAAGGDASPRTTWGLATGGALLGVVATEAVLRPAIGGSRGTLAAGVRAADAGVSRITGDRVQVTIDPLGAVFAAAGQRGRFSVMRVSF